MSFITKEFNKNLSRTQVRNLFRNTKGIELKIVKPINKERIVEKDVLEEFFEKAAKIVNGIESSLLFNIDETKFIPGRDEKAELVACSEKNEDGLLKGVDHSVRRITLLGSIAVNCTTIPKFFIVQRQIIEKKLI